VSAKKEKAALRKPLSKDLAERVHGLDAIKEVGESSGMEGIQYARTSEATVCKNVQSIRHGITSTLSHG